MSALSKYNEISNNILYLKDHIFFQMSVDKGVSAFPEDDNLFKWIGTIEGPSDTVSNGLFVLS